MPLKSGRRGTEEKKSARSTDAKLTRLKKKLQKLEREKKSLESLITYSSLGVVAVDKDMKITFCNSEFERIFQYKKSELIGKNLDETITDEHSFHEARELTRKTFLGEPIKGSGRRVRKDGTDVIVELYTAPIIVDGRFSGGYGLYVDVTDRVRETQALQESEALNRELINFSPLGIVAHDLDGKILFANQAALKILGASNLKDILGKNALEFIHPDSLEHVLKRAEQYRLVNVLPRTEEKVITLKGETIYLETNSIKITIKGIPAIMSVFQDITERKRIEQLLQESEARYRQLIESSPLPITVYDENNLFFANQAAIRMFEGTSPNDFSDKHLIDFIHPDSMPLVKKRATKLLQGESLPSTYEKLVTLKGNTIEVEVFSAPLTHMGNPAIMSVFSNVTERRKAEKKLQEQEKKYRILYKESKRQEELYRSLLNSSADAIIIYDLQGNTEFVNSSFTRMFGWTFEEVKGNRIPFVPEQEIAPSLAVITDLIENGTPVHGFETKRMTKDGKILDISISASRYNDHRGEPAGILVVLRDITDKKLTEKKLIEGEKQFRKLYKETKRQEELYRSLLNSSADAIIIYDLQGNTEFVNPSFTRMFGWTFEEVKGKQIPFVPDDEKKATQAAIHELFSKREPISNFETKRLTKEGQLLHISVSGSLFDDADGNPAGMLVVLRDITDRIKAEKAVHDSERRLRELYDSVSDLIYKQDLEGYFLSANRALVDLFGYTPDELVGLKASDFMKDKLKPLFKTEYLDVIKRTGHHEGISIYKTKLGKKVYLEHKSILVKPKEGQPFISGIARDVTERFLAEKRIKKLQEEMLQAQKMEAIGTLAGGIAHDFNNILMGIQGNISLLKLHTPKESPDFERLKSIEEHIQSGSELTSQLLGFARGGRYQVKPTDMNRLIEKEINLFGRAKKEMEIHIKFQENIWTVEVDQGQMEQVLLNLFVNAWQAMPKGGHLFIQTRNVVIDEKNAASSSLPKGKYVMITVTDTGIGMDSDTQKRIFEPFFTTKEKGRGTGLGLASVYGIIKNHGGIITVESAPHKGSTFTFYLPATEKPIQEEKEQTEKLVKGRGRVMLIDDEKKILEVGKLLLEAMGYEVVTFSKGQEALEAFKKEGTAFDLVILDMIMPGMGGREVFQELRNINPDVKVLLASGYSIDGEASKIMAQGCNGFIQKPFSMEKLSNKIQEVLWGT